MSPQAEQRLADLLGRELDRAQALLALLARESDTLSADPKGAQDLALEKEMHVRELERLEQERFGLLSATGVEDMDRLLATAADSKLHELWKQLLDAIGECRNRNQANGAVVEQRRHQVQQALAILHGQASEPQTYGAEGRAQHGEFSRTLAKA